MDLVAIAILCQIYTASEHQLSCQKWYIGCWNQKRETQLREGSPSRDFLSECVLEKK